MAPSPTSIDTVIVGTGPSALILSYILHGNIPVYIGSPPHPDPRLDAEIRTSPDLLHLDVPRMSRHFEASEFTYSTQALPVNALLDALISPNGDTCDSHSVTNVEWRHDPARAIPHILIGDSPFPGGQWAANPVHASWDIGALSYADMLSLPAYSFAAHHFQTTGKPLHPFTRPSRHQVTSYLRMYPEKVGISSAIHNGQKVAHITRTSTGFSVSSHNLLCKHLVLASGVFSSLVPPPVLLSPLLSLPLLESAAPLPILLIGSGFSAADIITSTPPTHPIIHIYKWHPHTSPSPLRACHHAAYPDYAGVYRRMRRAAKNPLYHSRNSASLAAPQRPSPLRRASSAFDASRDWDKVYEGFPNAEVTQVRVEDGVGVVELRTVSGAIVQRRVGKLEFVAGRRGSLDYLSPRLRGEVLKGTSVDRPDSSDSARISGQTLRAKIREDVCLADGVFAVGSLTGDSLIRFAFGVVAEVAGRIGDEVWGGESGNGKVARNSPTSSSAASRPVSNGSAASGGAAMSGLDGHHGGITSDLSLTIGEGEAGDREKKVGR